MLRNPVTANFFAQEAIEDPAEALVRESIQNSLDARRGADKTRVRFALHAPGPGDRGYLASILAGLAPHLTCEDNGLEEPPDIIAAHRYAVVEDFGTKGLEGDPEQWVPVAHANNDFYAFFRAEGHTDKGEDDRGRWGVGKTVFPRSSEANTFFALTVRASDHKALLMGRCVLKSHRLGSMQYHPDGFYGTWRDGLALPVSETGELEAFSRTFGLTRGQQPGLSVVIPLVQDDITFDSLLRAVLRDYFFAILSDDLEVAIESEGASIALTSSNLEAVAREYEDTVGADIAGLVRLAVWSKDIPTGRQFELACPRREAGAQTWEDFELDEALRNRLREGIASGIPLAIRIGIRVRRKHGGAHNSWCDAFLVQTDGSEKGRPMFIREGIVVSNANGARAKGILSIVSITHKPLATFLGDAENVAHTEWSADRSNFQQRYVYAKATLRLVKNCVAELVRSVMAGREDRDPDLLKDFFSFAIPDDDESLDEELTETQARKRRPGGPPPLPITPPRYRVSRIEGGFAVHRGDPSSPLPAGLVVRVAYDVRRGSALNAYNPADFLLDTGAFQITRENLETRAIQENRIDLSVTGADFRLEVRGFDPLRDLFVRVDPIDRDDVI